MVRRIAVLSDRFPPSAGGGIAAVQHHVFLLLKKRGYDVKGFAYFDELSGGEVIEDGDFVRYSPSHGRVRFFRRLCNLGFRIADPGKIAYQFADVLIRTAGASRLNQALRDFAPQVILFPDHGSPSLFVKPIPGCKRVMGVHQGVFRFLDLPMKERFSKKDIRLAMAFERLALRRMDKVVCPSRYIKSEFVKTYGYKGPVENAPNFVDEEYFNAIIPFDPRRGMGLSHDAPLVYIPGGGNRFKGSEFVVDIVSRLSAAFDGEIGFFISGAAGEDMKRDLAGVGDGCRLYIPGATDGPTNIATVKACNLAISPTLVENYSLALLEAALSGVPIVTFDVGGNAEIVRDGVTGNVVPARDIDAMVTAAARLLDPDEQRRASEATKAFIVDHLGEKVVGDRYVQALTEF